MVTDMNANNGTLLGRAATYRRWAIIRLLVTDALNALTVFTDRNCLISASIGGLQSMEYVNQSIASENGDHPAYEVASAARFTMENTAEELDLWILRCRRLASLVAAGVFSQAAADDLYTRVTTMISPAQAAGLPPIKIGCDCSEGWYDS